MAPQREVKAKLNTLRQALRHESSLRLQHGSLKDDYLEAILARGDRRLGAFLLETHRQRGNWPRAAKALDFDAMNHACQPLSRDVILPWDFLETDRQRQRLHREHGRAMAAV